MAASDEDWSAWDATIDDGLGEGEFKRQHNTLFQKLKTLQISVSDPNSTFDKVILAG